MKQRSLSRNLRKTGKEIWIFKSSHLEFNSVFWYVVGRMTTITICRDFLCSISQIFDIEEIESKMLAVIHYNQFYFYHHIKCHALYTCWLVGIKGEEKLIVSNLRRMHLITSPQIIHQHQLTDNGNGHQSSLSSRKTPESWDQIGFSRTENLVIFGGLEMHRKFIYD